MSRLTGFSPALLRAWESRHHLLSPRRGPGGQRLYSDEDLAVLGRVRELAGQGRSIGEIAAIGRRQLLAGAGSGMVRSIDAASQAAARLASRLELEQLLPLLVETLEVDFHAALARIWVYAPDENVLYLRASAGLSRRTTTSSRARIDLARYPYKVGVVARTREPFVANGLVGDAHFDARWVKREKLASVAILPLMAGGRLRGVLACFFRRELAEEVVSALGTFATMAGGALAIHAASACSPASRRCSASRFSTSANSARSSSL